MLEPARLTGAGDHGNNRQRTQDERVRILAANRPRAPVEYKFNGWHDPEDGKFTFKGSGNYYASASGNSGERIAMARPPKPAQHGTNRGDGTWQGGGFTGGGGGSFGGGGATGSGWETPAERRARELGLPPAGGAVRREPQRLPGQNARRAELPSRPSEGPKPQYEYSVRKGDSLSSIAAREGVTVEQLASTNSIADPDKIKVDQKLTIPARAGSQPGWVSVQTDRLVFEIDKSGLTRVARGALGRANSGRSRTLQADAGKPDRQPTDDGGHLIAPRFGGPKAPYNHFAQDANFNRGAYRAMKDAWGKAQSEDKQVSVHINLTYSGQSRRPDGLEVGWDVAGGRHRNEFANRTGGRHD